MMLGGDEDGESLSRIVMTSLPFAISEEIVEKEETAAAAVRDRVPKWSQQETRELIAIRAKLERDFNVSKRNKILWEVVSSRMSERGYGRSPQQCKCKWKNLINRYKGKETSDPDDGIHCPFFEELHAVFNERAKMMQRLLLESESGRLHPKKKPKRIGGDKSSDDVDSDCENSDDDRIDMSRRKKTGRDMQSQRPATTGSILKILQEVLNQQQRMDVQWQEMLEHRVQERRLLKQEWRRTMEKLGRERLLLEQAWREREEQRSIREETRAEKRDAMLTTLLNRLINGEL